MIWSLLKQPYISDRVTWKDWQYCTWSKLPKELSLSLRHALERHELPAAVSAHVDYCGLDGPAALAKYAFNLGSQTQDPQTRDSQTQDPQTRDSQTQDSQTWDSQTRDSQTQDSQTQDSESWGYNLTMAAEQIDVLDTENAIREMQRATFEGMTLCQT
jgi:hypothetical protein